MFLCWTKTNSYIPDSGFCSPDTAADSAAGVSDSAAGVSESAAGISDSVAGAADVSVVSGADSAGVSSRTCQSQCTLSHLSLH